MRTGFRILAHAALYVALAVILVTAPGANGESRFPQPDFQLQYTQPVTKQPLPRAPMFELVDVAVLAVALCLAAYLALVKRSRRGILLLSVFSLAYFGFLRKGCICSVGAIQNVTLSFFDPVYTLPFAVLVFFFLPLLFALFFGRAFCGGVCPLGAVQDLVVIKPVHLHPAVSAVFALGPYLFLGGAVLLAACGAGFLICRHDPFVAFFRLSGTATAIVIGIVMLLAGIFIARPYCRFFCPYSVLLAWASRFARKHPTVTPDECIQCRLCERACPFDAIVPPSAGTSPDDGGKARRRLGLLLVLAPVIVAIAAWLGSGLTKSIESAQPAITLVAEIDGAGAAGGVAPSLQRVAFEGTGRSLEDLRAEAETARRRIAVGAPIFGGFMGLVIALQLIGFSVGRYRRNYEPDHATCLSCGRCFLSCPNERARLKKLST